MLSASHVAFISRPRPIDGKPKPLQRREKFLLLLEKRNYRTPRAAAGKATGGSGMKTGKGRGRGNATAALARCFRGIAAQQGCPFRKMSDV